jgi:hypothetical protein
MAFKTAVTSAVPPPAAGFFLGDFFLGVERSGGGVMVIWIWLGCVSGSDSTGFGG